MAKNGKAAELVVMQDGKPISLATGKPYEVDASAPIKRTITIDGATDEGVERSRTGLPSRGPDVFYVQAEQEDEGVNERQLVGILRVKYKLLCVGVAQCGLTRAGSPVRLVN